MGQKNKKIKKKYKQEVMCDAMIVLRRPTIIRLISCIVYTHVYPQFTYTLFLYMNMNI